MGDSPGQTELSARDPSKETLTLAPPGSGTSGPRRGRGGLLAALLLGLAVAFATPAATDTGAGSATTAAVSAPPQAAAPAAPTSGSEGNQSTQPGGGSDSSPAGSSQGRSMITFFAIGIVVNLAVLSLLGTWAYRQLRRRNRPH